MSYKRHQYKTKNTRYRTPAYRRGKPPRFITQSKFKNIKAKFTLNKREEQNKIDE